MIAVKTMKSYTTKTHMLAEVSFINIEIANKLALVSRIKK